MFLCSWDVSSDFRVLPETPLTRSRRAAIPGLRAWRLANVTERSRLFTSSFPAPRWGGGVGKGPGNEDGLFIVRWIAQERPVFAHIHDL